MVRPTDRPEAGPELGPIFLGRLLPELGRDTPLAVSHDCSRAYPTSRVPGTTDRLRMFPFFGRVPTNGDPSDKGNNPQKEGKTRKRACRTVDQESALFIVARILGFSDFPFLRVGF